LIALRTALTVIKRYGKNSGAASVAAVAITVYSA
jgi:hypothetical protein